MLDLELLARVEQKMREDTVYRRADLLAPFDRELELEAMKRRQRMGPRPMCWTAASLVAVGRRLTALGERIAPQGRDQSQPTA
jgi:hypothetical protein